LYPSDFPLTMMGTDQKVRVVLADDAGLVRSALRALLDRIEGIEVVGEAVDTPELFKSIRQHRPDVLLVHTSASRINCLEIENGINKLPEPARLILLSRNANGEYIRQALRSGVSGYLLMAASPDELELAIKTVAAGKTYVSPTGLKHLADFIRGASGKESRLECLTPRQREVLKLIAQGQSTKEIARTLNISVKTVESHRQQITERLDIHDIASLVRYAINVGLVELEDKTSTGVRRHNSDRSISK